MALSEYSLRLLGAYAEQPFLMAPMAGVTDPAYRIVCRRRGANLAYSEMVSVAGLAYASNKTWRLVLPADEEQQICVQLFGSKPDQFASAVAAVEERVGDRLSLIDINMAVVPPQGRYQGARARRSCARPTGREDRRGQAARRIDGRHRHRPRRQLQLRGRAERACGVARRFDCACASRCKACMPRPEMESCRRFLSRARFSLLRR